MSRTSPEWRAAVQAALWEAAERSGLELSAADEVAVSNALARVRPDAVTADAVRDAFLGAGLARPPARFAREVVSRTKRLAPPQPLREVLLDFRQWAIRNLSEDYGGKHKDENILRKHLLGYLPEHGYTEAHTGKGRTDILIPPPQDAVIETKLWTTPQAYEDGLEELGRYIHTEQPAQAYMVVFGDREPLPPIVADHRQAVAEVRQLEGIDVPVIVVAFELDAPSKAGRISRRRKRDSHGG